MVTPILLLVLVSAQGLVHLMHTFDFHCLVYDHYVSPQVGTSTSIPFFSIFTQLSLTVLIPLVLGQVSYSVLIV